MQETFLCRFTDDAPQIDGFLDEEAWARADEISLCLPVTHGEPEGATLGRLLWDERFLYVGMKAYDQDVWSYLTERDSRTCNEDVLEIFLKPFADQCSYYNFEINALGAVYDAFNVKRGAGGADHRRWSRWNCENLLVGVHVEGTLNHWEDTDQFWTLEVAIPFASLPSLKGEGPKPGDEWRFHLARYDYSVYLESGLELSSCARFRNTGESFFHRYDEWPVLRFVR